jgi:hypothetical protein
MRPSTRNKGSFALSVRMEDIVVHLAINPKSENGYSLGDLES